VIADLAARVATAGLILVDAAKWAKVIKDAGVQTTR
jgi:hypothetical protein